MGYMKHHAIIVTGTEVFPLDGSFLMQAHEKAREIFTIDSVTEPVPSPMNHCVSFMVAPDGSKEGWTESNLGDVARSRFIEWLKSNRYEDGGSPVKWVEVQYGDDERVTAALRHSDLR